MFDFVLPPWLRDSLFVLLAFFGGILGDVTRKLDKGAKVVLKVSFIKGAGSAFTGFLMLLFCRKLGLSYEATGVCVGVFGWLGSEVTIGFLQKAVYSKLGLDGETDDGSVKASTDVADGK